MLYSFILEIHMLCLNFIVLPKVGLSQEFGLRIIPDDPEDADNMQLGSMTSDSSGSDENFAQIYPD